MKQKQVLSRAPRYAHTSHGMIPFHTWLQSGLLWKSSNYLCVAIELFVQSQTRGHNKHLLRCHSDTPF
ncbi:Uncharacterized protein APZ42_011100 [Daphnia magna]|uniref:Uncharacterized protein n=1 Tax=Daphnia magna TaxID=35525 RepID=A0A162D0A7_9CRUS|nr:Uncharacterized protein APZ42_011100 [Daphnia magna]